VRDQAIGGERNSRTAQINHDIERRRGARGDEGLMILVRRGHDCGENNYGRDCDPRRSLRPSAQCSKRQDGKDSVFSQVSQLAHEELNLRDRLRGNIWPQPTQEGADESRSVFSGHEISRADEDNAEPDENRQPIFEKTFHGTETEARNLASARRTTIGLSGSVSNSSNYQTNGGPTLKIHPSSHPAE
jgi:hypothetical protein